MAWYAKPSGGYTIASTEGASNILEMKKILQEEYGWTLEAIAGAITNSYYEGQLNPWRWEDDVVNFNKGCGLFGFTTAQRYIDNYAEHMNLSTSITTSGAQASEGALQTRLTASGTWGWHKSCWRTYWDPDVYPVLYRKSRDMLRIYGNGSEISLSQYARITNAVDALFIFLCCFEGPETPNYNTRLTSLDEIYTLIGGHEPPTPPAFRLIWLLARMLKRGGLR